MVAEIKKEKTQEVMQTTFLKIPNHSSSNKFDPNNWGKITRKVISN
jgi:hypothetical protein